MDVLQFKSYEKMSDILVETYNLKLKINIMLSKKNKRNGDRYFYYNEYTYNTPKYDGMEVTSIIRNINPYFSLEIKDASDGSKNEIKIFPNELLNLKWQLETMYRILNDMPFINIHDSEEERVFRYNNGALLSTLTNNVDILNKAEIFTKLRDGIIKLIPNVITYNENNYKAVRILINTGNKNDNKTLNADIFKDEFETIFYILSNVNVYNYAASMLAAINRPDDLTSKKLGSGNYYQEKSGGAPF